MHPIAGRDPFQPLAAVRRRYPLIRNRCRWSRCATRAGCSRRRSRWRWCRQAASCRWCTQGEALGAERGRVLSMDDTQLSLRLPDATGVQRLALQEGQP